MVVTKSSGKFYATYLLDKQRIVDYEGTHPYPVTLELPIELSARHYSLWL